MLDHCCVCSSERDEALASLCSRLVVPSIYLCDMSWANVPAGSSSEVQRLPEPNLLALQQDRHQCKQMFTLLFISSAVHDYPFRQPRQKGLHAHNLLGNQIILAAKSECLAPM